MVYLGPAWPSFLAIAKSMWIFFTSGGRMIAPSPTFSFSNCEEG